VRSPAGPAPVRRRAPRPAAAPSPSGRNAVLMDRAGTCACTAASRANFDSDTAAPVQPAAATT
jgi:hypothetical protein